MSVTKLVQSATLLSSGCKCLQFVRDERKESDTILDYSQCQENFFFPWVTRDYKFVSQFPSGLTYDQNVLAEPMNALIVGGGLYRVDGVAFKNLEDIFLLD